MFAKRKDVPDFLKWENGGPYKKAPDEYGGEWWQVNPFYGSEPWLRAVTSPIKPKYPEGFIEVFGERPRTPEELSRWEQDMKLFKKPGPPEWITPEELDLIEKVTTSWEMGPPKYYEGRYGFQARFPEGVLDEVFEWPARGLQTHTHITVAAYQARMIEKGIKPKNPHPFTPPYLFNE